MLMQANFPTRMDNIGLTFPDTEEKVLCMGGFVDSLTEEQAIAVLAVLKSEEFLASLEAS